MYSYFILHPINDNVRIYVKQGSLPPDYIKSWSIKKALLVAVISYGKLKLNYIKKYCIRFISPKYIHLFMRTFSCIVVVHDRRIYFSVMIVSVVQFVLIGIQVQRGPRGDKKIVFTFYVFRSRIRFTPEMYISMHFTLKCAYVCMSSTNSCKYAQMFFWVFLK